MFMTSMPAPVVASTCPGSILNSDRWTIVAVTGALLDAACDDEDELLLADSCTARTPRPMPNRLAIRAMAATTNTPMLQPSALGPAGSAGGTSLLPELARGAGAGGRSLRIVMST